MSDSPGLVELSRLSAAARAELLGEFANQVDGPPEDNPLKAVTDLRRRRPDLSSDLVSAIVTQLGLQARARSGGTLAAGGPWLATPVGLEQASRPEVADRRAATLADAGIASVVDTGCGIGMDARAFLAAGMDVVAIERDSVTFEVARANLEHAARTYGTRARVQRADATVQGVIADAVASLTPPVAVFVDPARRGQARPADGGRSRAERDRELWSPPWSFVERLRREFDAVAVKTPPGFTPDDSWKAEWVAVGSSVVECAVYSPAASSGPLRQATILGSVEPWSLAFPVDATRPAPAGLSRYLAELHPVARRPGALAELCAEGDQLAPVTGSTMWLTSDVVAPECPALRWFEVLAEGKASQMRALCSDHGIEAVALKSVESRRPQDELRRKIRLPDGDDYAIVVISDLTNLFLVRRIRRM